jgi:hypothetical protein
LFLGETLLIPHLYPIVEALARRMPTLRIECWVATSVHEGLIAGWLHEAGLTMRVRIRRTPGFRDWPNLVCGENPPLPPKIPTLVRLLPYLLGTRAVVCAEQTSLWLSAAFPFLAMRFLKTSHGVGSVSARDDRRRRAAYRLLVPSEREKATYTTRGFADRQLVVTGYVKAGFRGLTRSPNLFDDDKPTIVYTPHWQQHRSSWWLWGRQVVDMLASQERFNVILAPHQRLVETAPEIREVLASVAHLPHIHADLDSFAMVDGSYMSAADIYLGDTSSQVVEFLIRPRPCIFLNPDALDWRATDDHSFWECGEVVDRFEALQAALDHAFAEHPRYEAEQRAFATDALGDASPEAAERAARAVIATLE